MAGRTFSNGGYEGWKKSIESGLVQPGDFILLPGGLNKTHMDLVISREALSSSPTLRDRCKYIKPEEILTVSEEHGNGGKVNFFSYGLSKDVIRVGRYFLRPSFVGSLDHPRSSKWSVMIYEALNSKLYDLFGSQIQV